MAIDNSEKSEYVDQRLDSLKEYFTYSLYSNVCRSLFEKHKLLFSFILTSKLKEAQGLLSSQLYEFLIQYQTGLDNPLNMENPCSSWLSTIIWNKVCTLAKLDARFTNFA